MINLLCSVFFSGSDRVVGMVDHDLEVLNSNPTPAKDTFFRESAVLKLIRKKSIEKMKPNCFCYAA